MENLGDQVAIVTGAGRGHRQGDRNGVGDGGLFCGCRRSLGK